MEITLQHTKENVYEKAGIFIENSSPAIWLQEITRMRLSLSDCDVYPCPGINANSIAGILLIIKKMPKHLAVEKNKFIQKVAPQFYIPEFTMLNMALTAEEFAKITHGVPHFLHHTLGLIELKEKLSWENILEAFEPQAVNIQVPSKGVRVPTQVSTFSVEISETEEETTMGNPFVGEEVVDLKKLPFDMEKVLKGNNIEIEKYLKYLEKNPEAALKMAVPLDMLGTARGKALAKYKFKSGLWQSIGMTGEGSQKGMKILLGIIAIICMIGIGYAIFDQSQANKKTISEDVRLTENQSEQNMKENKDFIPNNTSDSTLTNDSLQYQQILIPLLLIIVIILYFVLKKKEKQIQKKTPSWLELSEDSDFFSFKENSTKSGEFYFGGDELTWVSKLIVLCIIIGLLIYLFYPLVTSNGVGIIFALILGFTVLKLLYKLVRKDEKLVDD